MKKFGEANIIEPKEIKDLGVINSISQYLYLPSLNYGFNDLLVKPLAGATDFIDRTIDKAYTSVTGEDTPNWLRKGGGFDNIVKHYDEEYENRVKPTNLISDVSEGVIGTIPLIASMAIGAGEANVLSKAPQVFSNLTKLFAVKGALNSFKDATDEKQSYAESLARTGKGFVSGIKEGLDLDAMMLVGGALGKGVANELAKRGLFSGGKATKAALHALSIGTVFGGTSAGSDLLNGRDINTREAAKQFGMGLAFEIIPVAKGINSELKDRKYLNDISDLALKQAALAKSASNLNSESALRNLINLTPEQIQSINTGVKKTRDELYAESIESGAKAYDENNPVKKRELYIDQLVLKSQGDIKLLSEKISENSGEIKDLISKSEELTPLEKLELLDKIDLLNLKPKENAVQVETAGKVPVQSKAEVSGEVVEGKPKSEVEIAAEESAKAEEVARLRAAEQVELNDAIPNADQYKTDGKVDEDKLTKPEDKEVFNEIYDDYNELISPLLTEKIITELPKELIGNKTVSNTGMGGEREHTTGKVNLEDLKVLDNGIETAKKTLSEDKSFKPSKEPIVVGVDVNTGEKQLLDGYHRYILKNGNGEVDAKFIPMKDGNIIQFSEIKEPLGKEKIIAENIEIPKLNEDNLSNAIEDLTDIADTRRKDKRDIKMKKLEESMDMSSPEVKIAKGINDNFVEIKKQLKDKGILETKCK